MCKAWYSSEFTQYTYLLNGCIYKWHWANDLSHLSLATTLSYLLISNVEEETVLNYL